MHKRVGARIRALRGAAGENTVGWITHSAAYDALTEEMSLLRHGEGRKAMKGLPNITPQLEKTILKGAIVPYMALAD
jgi:hypothetical protein